MSNTRNFSMIEYFNRYADLLKPKLAFDTNTHQVFGEWKSNLLEELKKLLGPMPKPIDLNPEIVWEIEEGGLIKQKILLDLEEHMSVPALLYRPIETSSIKPAAAILCCHGHGIFGKDSVMGIRSLLDKRREQEILSMNFDYGLKMANSGYVTMAIDWRGFGERSDNSDSYMDEKYFPYQGRDRCNVHFIRGSIMGLNLLALDIFDAIRCIDYLTSLDFVDSERIGAMGLSFGGTMTMWLTMLDERIKAADIICYSCTFKNYAVKRAQFCGSQFVPGLFQICDVPDMQGLIAPRPLLAEIGINDKCFDIADALTCSRRVAEIYKYAGASNNYEVDIFEGDHQFAGNKVFNFFERHLLKD